MVTRDMSFSHFSRDVIFLLLSFWHPVYLQILQPMQKHFLTRQLSFNSQPASPPASQPARPSPAQPSPAGQPASQPCHAGFFPMA